MSPKIKASGAQSVVTGNYNRDLNLLIKAAVDAGSTCVSTPTWRI